MIQNLAIVTTETLPVMSAPCGGGGVRVWGLSEALRQHEVPFTFFLHENTRPSEPLPDSVPHRFYKPELLHDELLASGCDAVLFEQWQPMMFLKEPLELPTIVDLPGPLALEYYWRDPEYFYQHIVDKVNALSRADTFLCALDRQQGYYQSWLTWAGVSPEDDRLAVVPFTLHEMPRASHGHAEDEPTLFWGGIAWAWQDRTQAFETILRTLSAIQQGYMVLVGEGTPGDGMGFTFDPDHPHITSLGSLPFTEFTGELKRSTVAVDLCRPTVERRLASDLRTGAALWAGVPSIVTPASPWAGDIEEHNAGWVLDYDDSKGLEKLVRDIVLERCDMKSKRKGARVLSKQISDKENIAPLIKWLKAPQMRERGEPFFDARTRDREAKLNVLREEVFRLQHEKECLQHDLDSIRSNPLFRMYKSFASIFRSTQ